MADSKYDDEVVVTTREELKKEDVKTASAGAGVGIFAVILVVLLAFGGWYYFSGATPRSVGQDVTQGLQKTGEAAAEVKQAASDVVTPDKK